MSFPETGSQTVLAFVGLSILASVISNGYFGRGIRSASCTYETKFSPSSEAFGIWTLIYVFGAANLVEQIYSQSTKTGNYEFLVANVCYGLTWVFAALWTPAFTLTVESGGNVVPHPLGLIVAAVFLCFAAFFSMTAVFTSSAWDSNKKRSLKWIGGVAFGLLSGWVLVAASVNFAIAYNANYGKRNTQCDRNDNNRFTIFSPINDTSYTVVPLGLALAVCIIALYLPNPILPLPLIWALFWMRPSYFNYTAELLLIVVEVVALLRTFA